MHILFIVKNDDVEHLNIMLLSRLLKDIGHSVTVTNTCYRTIQKVLRKQSVDIIAYNTPTVYAQEYIDLNKEAATYFTAGSGKSLRRYYLVFDASFEFVSQVNLITLAISE